MSSLNSVSSVFPEDFVNLETKMNARDFLTKSLLVTGRFLVEPLWQMTGSYLKTISICKDPNVHVAKKTVYITKSIFSSFFLIPLSFGGLALGQLSHSIAHVASERPYIYLKRRPKVENTGDNDENFRFFQLNCCLTAGGFSALFGGTTLSNKKRAGSIVKMIEEENPDLVCLQEVSDLKDAYFLYKKLKNYSHFYFNIGIAPFIVQNSSGLFIASKKPLHNPHFKSYSHIKNTRMMVKIGFFSFATEEGNFITTHFSDSSDDLFPKQKKIDVRRQEQEMVLLEAIERVFENSLSAYVLGDFNINYSGQEREESLLFKDIKYRKEDLPISGEEVTAETQYLIDRNWHHNKQALPQHLVLDYFLTLFQSKGQLVETKVIKTFDAKKPREAISDHAALLTVIKC